MHTFILYTRQQQPHWILQILGLFGVMVVVVLCYVWCVDRLERIAETGEWVKWEEKRREEERAHEKWSLFVRTGNEV